MDEFHLRDDEPEPDYHEPPAPAADMLEAERHRARIRRLRAELLEIEAVYKAEAKRLKAAQDDATKSLADRIEYHALAIGAWHRRAFADGEVSKTIQLPSGNSELRPEPLTVEVVNEDKLRAFLEDEGDLDKVFPPIEPTLSRSALNDYVQKKRPKPEPEPGTILPVVNKDGQVVPGLQIRFTGHRWQRGGKL